MRRERRLFECILALSALSLLGCQSVLSSSSDSSITYSCPFSTAEIVPEAISYEPLADYSPVSFSLSSYSRTLEQELGDGVTLYRSDYSLNNGNKVQVHVVEADLSKCSIEAGTSSGKAELTDYGSAYTQLKAFEKKSGKKVFAISNADFFGMGSPVNAFVKDNLILKDSHNDNGYYDYSIWDSDLPVSMPMLFGVGNGQAKIGPIVKDKTVEETIKSKLTYNVYGFTKEGQKTLFKDSEVNTFTPLSASSPDFVFSTSRNINVEKGDVIFGISLEKDADITHGVIVSKETANANETICCTADVKYVVFPHEMGDPGYNLGDYLGYAVTSPDDSWLGYQTILGARHEIIRDGAIVPTVSLETTNGTAKTDIPRTSIGIKANGTVCLFSLEALRYGGVSTSENDPYGLSLPQLADFMRYYGIASGANFDGGGSTELIVNDGYNGAGQDKIVTRSSDYGTFDLSDGRAVMNTIVVTGKDD